jgi:hypothetical protein
MPSKFITCTCKNECQDKLYGVGKRVANEMRSGQVKCTVCSTVHGSTSLTMPTKSVKSKEKPAEPAAATGNDEKPGTKKRSLKGNKR